MAETGKRERASFKDLRAGCELLEKDLRDCAGKITYEQLIDESFWYEFVSPDLDSQERSYMYMGRKFTGDVIRFIVEGNKAKGLIKYRGPPLHHSRKKYSFIRYLSGTPGFGKTVSLHTAFVYLYLRSMEAADSQDHRESVSGAPRISESSSADVEPAPRISESSSADVELVSGAPRISESNPDVKRFVLLTGDGFVEEPLQVLLAGLVMAYIKDDQALADLEGLADYRKLDPSSKAAFSWFLRKRTETVFIILDDGNAFDDVDGDTEDTKATKKAAFGFLTSLMQRNVKVVICASVRSKLRSMVHKERADYLLGTGGFSEDEVCNYLKHLTGKEARALAYKIRTITGWVPRLVVELLTNKRVFEMTNERLELDLIVYVANALRDLSSPEKTRLLSAVAGQRIPSLSPVLDSRCFYSGPDRGEAKCLTPALHAIAIGAVVEGLERSGKETAVAQINQFTSVVGISSNISSIGWAAEAATLLVLRLLSTTLPKLDLHVDPDLVVIFSGRLTSAKMDENPRSKVLFIPKRFNHAGADAYYVTQEAIVVIQISVASEYEKGHPNTEEVASELFHHYPARKKVIAWIVVRAQIGVEEREGVHRVHIPFGELHPCLECISKRIQQLRGERGLLCPRCSKSNGSLKCCLCFSWFHEACEVVEKQQGGVWYCSDCRVGLDDSGGSDSDDDDVYEDPDYKP